MHTTTYTYEDNRKVKTVVDNVVSSLSVSKYTYSYDAIARRSDRIQEGSAFSQASFDAFDYNNLSEVIGSDRYLGTDTSDQSSPITGDVFDYAYDPIGNRLSRSAASSATYTTNEMNQYISITGQSSVPTHDADGNQTQSSSAWVYKWNAENRLIEAYSFAEDKKLQFAYDYMGRRVQKDVTVLSIGASVSSERFLYDSWNLIATFTLSDLQIFELSKAYTWGLDLSQTISGAGGVGGLLGVEELSGSHAGVYHFTYDVNGNVSEVLDDSGAIAAHYEYSPFGEVVRSTGFYADANVWRFSTKYLDVETDFYYYGYRHYDSATGRWPSRDPIGERGGLNLYSMVGNDAVNYVDLLGRDRLGDFPKPERGRLTREESFDRWYKGQSDVGWTDDLPNCPDKICIVDGKPENCSAENWGSISDANQFHPGAKWCMRSSNSSGGAQQCCYDEDGKIIKSGLGAGTPDKASASFINYVYLNHYFQDVAPFQLAWDLDGGVLGSYLSKYLEVRPPNQGGGTCY